MWKRSIHNTSTIAFLFFLLTGCKTIAILKIYQQKKEMSHEYNTYLHRTISDSSYSYQLLPEMYDSISHEKYALNTYKLKTNTNASGVQIRMYDQSGLLINGYEQCFGDLKKTHLLDSFPMKQIAHLPINKTLRFQTDIHLFCKTPIQKQELIELSNQYHYTICVYYAEWMGWYAESTLKQIKQYISKQKEEKILFIKINSSPKKTAL
ncbi:MAG: hypothetical protein JNL24_06850 [Bacteroidia bacterium]|nr:hypothetical protein [Bacteroidia bacterium]